VSIPRGPCIVWKGSRLIESTNRSVEVLEPFLSAGPESEAAARHIISSLKGLLKQGDGASVGEILPRAVVPGLDYTTGISLYKLLKQLRQSGTAHGKKCKIGLLGTMTTEQLADLLDLHLYAGGVGAEFYRADYGTIHQEIFDPNSGLKQFQPDIILILTSWRDLQHAPELTDSRDVVSEKVGRELASWTSLWKVAQERFACQIIQSNFAPPPWRTLGNLESRHPAGLYRYISLVNRALADHAPHQVTLLDVEALSAAHGRWDWSDDRFFHQAKLPCSPEHLVDYAHSVAALIVAQLGLGRKCLVLDLDNTLWGGVIGDDGLGGIRIGQGNPEAEAFAAFQLYVKRLRERGVILAVCSKNDEHTAREVFEKHSEMILRLEDISCFVANWDDKAANLARIAERLNIGLNSLVFVDDNPAERSIVRQFQPAVAVPEMPDNPAYYIRALDRHRYFEPLSISGEDLKRTQFYRADTERQALETSAADLDSFLRSLDMRAHIEAVTAETLERTVQLINRSNQFNLTTRRYTNAEVLTLMADPHWITLTVTLRDRFGDNGLISVLFAQAADDTLLIDTWLMSCRVLKRGVERLLLNRLVSEGRARGTSRIRGEYIPSAKNGLVRDHYAALGFAAVPGPIDAHGYWELPIGNAWQPLHHFIGEV
jgi:FkbH-like protein